MRIELITDKDIESLGTLIGIWRGMISRCKSPKNKHYPNYGGRGIKVCDAWLKSFPCFVRDMWPRPDNQTLDRINNDGNYEPGNCRWATATEQVRNRRISRFVTIDGKKIHLLEACEQYNVNYDVFMKRTKDYGWNPEQALGIASRTNPLTTELTYKGDTLPFKIMATKYGLSVVCLRKRLESGLSLEEALTKPLESRGGVVSLQRVMVGGVSGTIKDFAKERGLEVGAVYARFNKLGWTIEQALGIDPAPKRVAWNKKR